MKINWCFHDKYNSMSASDLYPLPLLGCAFRYARRREVGRLSLNSALFFDRRKDFYPAPMHLAELALIECVTNVRKVDPAVLFLRLYYRQKGRLARLDQIWAAFVRLQVRLLVVHKDRAQLRGGLLLTVCLLLDYFWRLVLDSCRPLDRMYYFS